MSVYHFNVFNGEASYDNTGVEFETLHDARTTAVRYFAEILREKAGHMQDEETAWRVEVTDSNGLILFTIITSMYNAPVHGHGSR